MQPRSDDGEDHVTMRQIAEVIGIGACSVRKYVRAMGMAPHRVSHPCFDEQKILAITREGFERLRWGSGVTPTSDSGDADVRHRPPSS